MKNRCKQVRSRHDKKMAKAKLHGRPIGAPNRTKAHHRNRRSKDSCHGWR